MKKAKRWNKKISPREKKGRLTDAKRNFLLAIYLILLGVVLTSSFMIYNYLTKSEDFIIKEVEICGKPTFSRREIENILKFCKGKNIFKVNLSHIKAYLDKDTGLENVLLEKDFPDRLIVRINERDAIARYGNLLVDCDGMTFNGKDDRLLEIIGPGGKENMKMISSFLFRLKQYDENLYKRIQGIDFRNSRKVKICFGGWNLYWGGLKELSKDDIMVKTKYLKVVLRDLQRKNQKVDYIDLRHFDKTEPSVIVKTL